MSNYTTFTNKQLSELLDEKQLKQVFAIIQRIQRGTTEVRILRDYLRTQSDSLETRGVVADYLYYFLVYRLNLE